MDFEAVFGSAAFVFKRLEIQWFMDADGEQTVELAVHRLPFQRRNLSYLRGIQYGVNRKSRSKSRHISAGSTFGNSKSMDLLYSLWKHRVRNYNDAFLSTPRSVTRNYSKASDGVTWLVEDESPGVGIEDAADLEGDDSRNSRVDGKFSNGEKCIAATIESVGNLMSEEDESLHQAVSFLDDPMKDVLTWTKRGATRNEGSNSSSSWGRLNLKTRVLFHFLYNDPETHRPCFLTDHMSDLPSHRRCAFCYFDGASDVGLLMHCVTFHGHEFLLRAAKSEDGTLHIVASKKTSNSPDSDEHDFVYVRRPAGDEGAFLHASVPFVKRTSAKVGTMDQATRRKKMRLLSEMGAGEDAMKQFVVTSDVPVRQYFHSRSNEPMLEGEWDVDSDDEEDDGWLIKMSEELLDEFEDVTDPEKKFAKLWNRFMRSHTVTADRAIPSKCFEFVRTHVEAIVSLELRQELLLHLSGLWDFGLISSTHLSDLMSEFDKLGACVTSKKDNNN